MKPAASSMSASSDSAPTPAELGAVQMALIRLDEICETEPQKVINDTEELLRVCASWTRSDAYAWVLALRAKAFRFLDRLTAVLEAASVALRSIDGDASSVAAHLHLESGMALNQFGLAREAVGHLQDAERIFARAGDDAGRAWALVSLAEAYADGGGSEDPEPIARLAIELAQQSGDGRAERRGWKQLAVICRYRGRPVDALEAIGHALAGNVLPHARANYLLELGHLEAWLGHYAVSDDAYQEAAVIYAEYGDQLGQANIERALASNALILGRNAQGRTRLDRAAGLYRQIGNRTGLGYVLRDRCLVRLTEGDKQGAVEDVEEALGCFRDGPGVIGLAGTLRTAAKIRQLVGDIKGSREAFGEAEALTQDSDNPLAEAGLQLLLAEIGGTLDARLAAGMKAAGLYKKMGIQDGEAYALSHIAGLHAGEGRVDDAVVVLRESQRVLRTARAQVLDPGRRGDHDFALRDVTTNLLTAAQRLGDAGRDVFADLVLDEAPLGLRRAVSDQQVSAATRDFIARIQGISRCSDDLAFPRTHLLQRLGSSIASVDLEEGPAWCGFNDFAAAHPRDAILAVASPTRNHALPVVWKLPGSEPEVQLVGLDSEDVSQINALSYAFDAARTDILWRPELLEWQSRLAGVLVPRPVQTWLVGSGPRSISVLLPPVLTHVPIEALLLDDQPIGVRAAITRIVVPTATRLVEQPDETVAYFDPGLEWSSERQVLANVYQDAEDFRTKLGPGQLIIAACHGESALRAEGSLVAASGERVLDAIDLLAQPLSNSVLVLEACFAGRYMGPRTGEPLNLATVGLLSGAASVVAGLFAIPASDRCTGVIMAELVAALLEGYPAAEALRRARERYWRARPEVVGVPGKPGMTMCSSAPWAWAGLCAYSR